MIFDTHAHYDDDAFDEDRFSLIEDMHKEGVMLIMNACTDIEGLKSGRILAEKYPFVYMSAGVHPHDVGNLCESDMEIIKKAVEYEKVKSIGEIGLDYYYDNSPRDVQKKWFLRQVELAKEVNLPVMIHDRDAHKDTLDILHYAKNEGGVFHCFSGSVEMAREVLDMDMYIAIGGSVTFKNAKMPRAVVEYVPLDKLVIETDSPYLTPVPNRGKRNCSIYLKYVIETIAEIKGLSPEEIEKITYENGKRLFNIEN